MNEGIMASFRDSRYFRLNQVRWEQFLSMDIPLRGKTVLEVGAGIGDQTDWLLDQGIEQVWVNDGRESNVEIIRERFDSNERVTILPAGDLETVKISDVPFVDLVFCYGVYYHVRDPEFRLLKQLSTLGEMLAMDYLEGNDNEVFYGYDNPSTSLSQYATRHRTETLLQAMTDTFGYAYIPIHQLEWQDPLCAETRLIAVASHFLLDNPNLIRFDPLLTQTAS